MNRILFAFLFLFSCALIGCTEKLNAEEDVLSAVSEEIADLEELESRIEELCEGEGAVHEENRKMIAAVGKKFEEAKAEMEKNQEELRQSWAALPEDVAVKLLQRLVEDPELKFSSVRSLCPENISLTDFLKMVNVGKRCAPAIREYIFAEAANDKAKELGDTFVATSLAGLEQAVDEKKAEILLKLMEDCPGYNDIDADFPLEELIPPIDALVEKFGWNEKKVVDAAENFWLTARPCRGKPGARMVKTVDGIEYAFRWCPAGSFTMGGTGSDEKPHSVTLTKGFWMLETEVTQAMWESVMGTSILTQASKGIYCTSLKGTVAEYPIYYVNWEESRTFCKKLSSKLGVQVSLPTEAQWEYACRAGTTGAYAGDIDKMGWYWGNSGSKIHPVGKKTPNAWGLYDMHGNVWEWCLDVYEKNFYARSPSSDPCNWKDENSGSFRVYRGGSWDDFAESCRSANRSYFEPGDRYDYLGFRIVLADPAPVPPVTQPVPPPAPPKLVVRPAGDRMVKTVDGIEYAFRWCPAGTFTMGGTGSDEKPHSVTLTKGFWMLETEVTQAMWKSVMGENPSYFKGDQNPVDQVSWDECQDFCRKLSSKLSGKVSLPTEAQWEYACRAGTTGAHAGDLDAMGWYYKNSGSKTHPVGQKKANEWGLYDMHGNVWEWCLDVYDEDFYARSPSINPCNWKDENSGSFRVNRGGCWYRSAEGCRSAYRYCDGPGSRDDDLGFRIVLADPAPGK